MRRGGTGRRLPPYLRLLAYVLSSGGVIRSAQASKDLGAKRFADSMAKLEREGVTFVHLPASRLGRGGQHVRDCEHRLRTVPPALLEELDAVLGRRA